MATSQRKTADLRKRKSASYSSKTGKKWCEACASWNARGGSERRLQQRQAERQPEILTFQARALSRAHEAEVGAVARAHGARVVEVQRAAGELPGAGRGRELDHAGRLREHAA